MSYSRRLSIDGRVVDDEMFVGCESCDCSFACLLTARVCPRDKLDKKMIGGVSLVERERCGRSGEVNGQVRGRLRANQK